MTREEAKQLLPIIQAYAEGKTIQFLNGGKWYDVYDTDFHQSPDIYRIKPEPNYRPFNSQEECWEEMLKHQPFGWVRSINTKRLRNIDSVGNSSIDIKCNGSTLYFDVVLNVYTFADGTPFGIKEG